MSEFTGIPYVDQRDILCVASENATHSRQDEHQDFCDLSKQNPVLAGEILHEANRMSESIGTENEPADIQRILLNFGLSIVKAINEASRHTQDKS